MYAAALLGGTGADPAAIDLDARDFDWLFIRGR
jgi:hypothetical protein